MADFQQETMGSVLLNIWLRIRDELASLQDNAPDEFRGHVVNSISGSIYTRDTAFAAQVFATEYRRTGDEKWLLRSKAALNSLRKMDIYGGLDEPIWNRYGWHFKKGSLATTGMLLDAVWEARNLVGLEYNESDVEWQLLAQYLESCLVHPGFFAHDTVRPGSHPSVVLNTTAIALYLLEYMALKMGSSMPAIVRKRALVYSVLSKGQRMDGFWPYVYPGTMQQVSFRFPIIKSLVRYLPIVRKYFINNGDTSIYFGDAVHHCLVLYYLTKSLLLSGSDNRFKSTLDSAWQWVYRKLLPFNGSLILDFNWEPEPTSPRYCNFRETSAYFLILATLPLLFKMRIVGDNYRDITLQLLTHIQYKLIEPEGVYPCIKPYEGPIKILRNILPRVGESVAWKGGCLSNIVLMDRSLLPSVTDRVVAR